MRQQRQMLWKAVGEPTAPASTPVLRQSSGPVWETCTVFLGWRTGKICVPHKCYEHPNVIEFVYLMTRMLIVLSRIYSSKYNNMLKSYYYSIENK